MARLEKEDSQGLEHAWIIYMRVPSTWTKLTQEVCSNHANMNKQNTSEVLTTEDSSKKSALCALIALVPSVLSFFASLSSFSFEALNANTSPAEPSSLGRTHKNRSSRVGTFHALRCSTVGRVMSTMHPTCHPTPLRYDWTRRLPSPVQTETKVLGGQHPKGILGFIGPTIMESGKVVFKKLFSLSNTLRRKLERATAARLVFP